MYKSRAIFWIDFEAVKGRLTRVNTVLRAVIESDAMFVCKSLFRTEFFGIIATRRNDLGTLWRTFLSETT